MTTSHLDRDSSVPLYVQLTSILRDKIDRGEWTASQRIPSENELNRLYGVSRMTARQVLAQLVSEGMLFRVQGKGTFVSPKKIATKSPAYKGIREQLEQQGYETSTELIETAIVEADSKVARHLRLNVGDPVHSIVRLRKVEGDPISLHHSFVPTALAADLIGHDPAHEQLCVILEREYSLRMSTVHETLETASAGTRDASVLGVKRNAPLLLLQQEIDDTGGTRFEYSRILFRGDKIRLEFEYVLD